MNGTNPGGQTALILAALMGQAEVVSLLLSAGADRGIRDRHGLTALDWSIRRGFSEATQLLETDSASGEPLRAKATPARPHVDAGSEVGRPIPDESKSEGLRPEGLGPAAQATLKAFQARRRSDADLSESGGQTLAKELERQDAENPSYAIPIPSATVKESRTPETENVSTERLNRFEEEVGRKAADEELALTSEAATTLVDTTPESTSPTSIPEIQEPIALKPQSAKLSTEQRSRSHLSLGLSLPASAPPGLAKSEGDDVPVSSVPSASSARPLVWLLAAIVLVCSAWAAYRVTQYFFPKQTATPLAPARVEPSPEMTSPEIKKLSPTIRGALAGLEVTIPDAEYPGDAQRAGISDSITVRIQVNRAGKVVSARSSSGDRRLRNAATKAAKQATFSIEKLKNLNQRGRLVAGSITYLFTPLPPGATGAPPATSAPTNPATTAAQSPTATGVTGDGTSTLGSVPNADAKLPVVGGPLMGAAIDLPVPEYPRGARRSGISGTIEVTVRVNRAGKVISWRTSPGDRQLRAAALKAARKATFARDKLPGTGDVVGTITYNFSP